MALSAESFVACDNGIVDIVVAYVKNTFRDNWDGLGKSLKEMFDDNPQVIWGIFAVVAVLFVILCIKCCKWLILILVIGAAAAAVYFFH